MSKLIYKNCKIYFFSKFLSLGYKSFVKLKLVKILNLVLFQLKLNGAYIFFSIKNSKQKLLQ